MRLSDAAQLIRHGMDPYNGAIDRKLTLTVVIVHALLVPFLCLLTWFDNERLKREEVPVFPKEVIIPVVMNLPGSSAPLPAPETPLSEETMMFSGETSPAASSGAVGRMMLVG